MKISKSHLVLLSIVFLGACMRFWALGRIPNGTTPDEITSIYNAYSIYKTQKDIAGNYLPLSFNFLNSFSPVPVYSLVPFFAFFDLSLFSARLPLAIMGSISIVLVFFIAKHFFKNNTISLASSFVFAISPWHINLSRALYECSFALFFILLGTYIFLKYTEKRKIYWSLPAFFLGFYSYHGTKLFLLFYIPLLVVFFVQNKNFRRKELGIFLSGIVLIFLSFFIISTTQHVTRQDVFVWNNIDKIGQTVDLERQFSNAPVLLKDIFSNKILVALGLIQQNYLYAFSPDYLFLKGESGFNTFLYNIGYRGMMYGIELPFLLLGIFSLLLTKARVKYFLIISLLLAPISSSLAIDQSYGSRSIMMLPFLAMITGFGLWKFYEYCRKLRPIIFSCVFAGLTVIYIFFVSSYLYQYYFRFSIYGDKYWYSTSEDVVKYIASQKNNYKQILVADSGGLLMYYGLFNKVEPEIIQKAYQSSLPRYVDNISFIGDCLYGGKKELDPTTFLPKNTLYIIPQGCYSESETKPIKVITWRDQRIHVEWNVFEN